MHETRKNRHFFFWLVLLNCVFLLGTGNALALSVRTFMAMPISSEQVPEEEEDERGASAEGIARRLNPKKNLCSSPTPLEFAFGFLPSKSGLNLFASTACVETSPLPFVSINPPLRC